MMRLLILFISIFLFHISLSAQSEFSKKKYLQDHAIELNKDSSDFSFLKPLIGEKQFVFLSDGHQSGSSKIYFTQLIKYLHEELDFDVLVLESGIYGAELANNAMNITPSQSNLISQNFIAQFISGCDASKQLFDYIGETKSGEDPLQLSGLDIEFNRTQQLLFQMLDSAFREQNDKILSDKNYILFKNYFDSLATFSSLNNLDNFQKNLLFQYADTLRSFINKLNDPTNFLFLIGENISAYVQASLMKSPSLNSVLRNSQMFVNLQWLIKAKYSGKKIIIWASPAHLAPGFMEGEIPMAVYFYQQYSRDNVFYLACSNYEPDGKSTAPNGSLNADMHQSKMKTAVLLFHQAGEEKSFINQTKDSRFFDAVLFIDDLKSCTWNY